MAELVGLVASIAGLAGIAATISITLFESGRNLSNARNELNSIAADVLDLSTVLEYLTDVVKAHESNIVEKTVKIIRELVERCKTVLEELRLAAELVNSQAARLKWLFRKPKTMEYKLHLEGFKSNLGLVIQTLMLAGAMEQQKSSRRWFSRVGRHEQSEAQSDTSAKTQRNINLLRGAIIANKGVFSRMREVETETSNPLLSDDVTEAGARFDEDTAAASINYSSSSLILKSETLTWEKVLLRSFDAATKEQPASEVLNATIPAKIQQTRVAGEIDLTGGKPESATERTRREVDEEISILLNEWTNTSKSAIESCLGGQIRQERNTLPDVPKWVQDEYSFVGYDAQDPAHWEHKESLYSEESTKILPYSRFAYDATEEDHVALFDLLAGEGGSWVWRHELGNQRDYFVGERKIVQYFMKPPRTESEVDQSQIQVKTVVGRQWISKEILENSIYTFRPYGEGSYAINGKLNPTEVRDLHIASSNRIEELLRRLAAPYAEASTEKSPPTTTVKVLATLSFHGTMEGDLSFEKGDILEMEAALAEKQKAWCTASLRGRSGLIPLDHVRKLTDTQESGTSSTETSSEEKQHRFDRWKAKFHVWKARTA